MSDDESSEKQALSSLKKPMSEPLLTSSDWVREQDLARPFGKNSFQGSFTRRFDEEVLIVGTFFSPLNEEFLFF